MLTFLSANFLLAQTVPVPIRGYAHGYDNGIIVVGGGAYFSNFHYNHVPELTWENELWNYPGPFGYAPRITEGRVIENFFYQTGASNIPPRGALYKLGLVLQQFNYGT